MVDLAEIESIIYNSYNLHNFLDGEGIWLARRRGQNFLVDKSIAEEIVGLAGVKEDDSVIEVGTGLGSLTIPLSKKTKKLISFEIDKGLCRILKEKWEIEKVLGIVVECRDFLKVDLKRFLGKWKVVSNLPYSSAGEIIKKCLEELENLEYMVVMVQKEFFERITADPNNKNYSAITVIFWYFAYVEKLLYVSKKHFFPVPEVDSVVIKIVRKEGIDMEEGKRFAEFVKNLFSNRRKTLKNSLKNIFDKGITDLGEYGGKRVEELTPETIYKLFKDFSF